jgi:flagellar M-ring protein FliF
MQRITQLVRSAVGFNEQRGDLVEVVNVQFAAPQNAPGTEVQAPGMFDFGSFDLMRIIELAAMLIASLAFVFFVLRPLIGGLVRGGAPAGGGPPALPGPGGAAVALPGAPIAAGLPSPEGVLADIEPAIDIAQIQGRVRASSVKKVAEVVDKHPDESMQIIRGWLNNAM